ncbi:MAG: HD domain-containing protein [Oscillospiraceae bacterium]|nr:HD domain-containing protein [Oscillospiraceae bacterium]
MGFTIPGEVAAVVEALAAGGFEAYFVGGCVRDLLRGVTPEDWDVCTSAEPEQTARCLGRYTLIETGIKHGTLSALSGGTRVEVTTFRTDGAYSDGRHPDRVTFVRSLREDLARRDFTINAMAYALSGRVIDCFGGRSDLSDGVIRCVGDGAARFREDALRIMRALRFASTLGFAIEDGTRRAALENSALLRNISPERVSAELGKLLIGVGAAEALGDNVSVIEAIIPELSATVGFEQHNPYHDKTVWEHTVASVGSAPRDMTVRLALLLHDIAKPACYTNVNGIGHFHGHPAAGAEIARGILRRLRFSGCAVDAVSKLIYHHDDRIRADARTVRRWLGRLGETRLRQLIAVQRADTCAHSPFRRRERLAELDDAADMLDGIISQNQCVTLRDLAVGGRDVIGAGVKQGPAVGSALRKLLELVIDGELPNERGVLIEKTKEITVANN